MYEAVTLDFEDARLVAICDLELEDGHLIVKTVRDIYWDGESWNLPIDQTADGIIQEVQGLVDDDHDEILDMLAERSAAI